MNYMLTNAGIELNAKIQSGAGAVLKITRAAGASGYSNNAGELSDLLNVKQTIQIEQIVREGITVTFGLILSNVGIEEEYILMQIGIYAEDPDTGKEILYIIGQDARGERVPAISEAQVEYKFNISQKISNTSSVVFETSPSDFLTKKVFTDFVDTVFSTHVNNKSNPHELTIEQLGAAAADHKHAAGDITGGTLPVDRGGTGGATPTAARTNLGLGTAATQGTANNLTTTAAGYVLDARQGKVLQDEIGQISSDLGGNILSYNESEDAYYIQYGADSVPKKLGSTIYKLGTISGGGSLNLNLSSYDGYSSFTVTNIFVDVTSFYVGVSSNGTNKYPPGGAFTTSRSITYDKDSGQLNVALPRIYKESYGGNNGSTSAPPAITQGHVIADVYLIT